MWRVNRRGKYTDISTFFSSKEIYKFLARKIESKKKDTVLDFSLVSPDTVDRFKLGISKASGSQREENPGQPRILHAYSLPESFVNFSTGHA